MNITRAGRKRTLLFAGVIAALLSPVALAPTAASAGQGHHHRAPVVRVLASGLQGTSGGTIGPDGALYVTEAAIGQVTRIDTRTGARSVFASGLPLPLIPLGGAIDVAFVGKTAFVLVTVVGPDVGGSSVDGIYRVDDADSFTVIADLGEYSRTHPPTTAFDLNRGLQFALQPYRGGFLVTDGHHNRVLQVSKSGVISQVVQLGNIVPTGLDVSGKRVYLAEAGPVPHNPADGKVVTFGVKHPVIRELASGYSLLVDVEFGPRGSLYALSQGDSPGNVPAGSPALGDSGELLRVTSHGRLAVVVDGLNLPTSVDFVRDTAYVVTVGGEILKITNLSGSHRQR
jgi:sugar lactone lactonase YvrE